MIKKSVKFTDEQYKQIQNEANELELNISEFIRYKLGFTTKRDKQLLIYHIARIGNNVNQLARAMNTALKIQQLTRAEMQIALTRLLCIQGELKSLREDFWNGDLGDVNKGW